MLEENNENDAWRGASRGEDHQNESMREAYMSVCENLRALQRKYDALKEAHNELLWDPKVTCGLTLPEIDEGLVESADRVSEIELVKVIGRGNFSNVFLGTWPSGQRCAVKRISKGAPTSLVDLKNIATEYEALVTLSRGPGVLALHCAFASPSHVYFVMEFFGQELFKYLKNHDKGLPRTLGNAVVHGVANGLHFMHSLNFAHRDIKPENVLIQVVGDRFSDVVVKLCDLGLCAKLETSNEGERRDDDDDEDDDGGGDATPLATTTTAATRGSGSTIAYGDDDVINRKYKPLYKCCGSMGFFAPDMLCPRGYDGSASDVWSLGCLSLEVIAGTNFFESFWFQKYTVFFKRKGRNATDQEFGDWMRPAVLQLRELVTSYGEECQATEDEENFRAKFRKNRQILSIASSCLHLDPRSRPSAFEVREMIFSSIGSPDSPIASSPLGDLVTDTTRSAQTTTSWQDDDGTPKRQQQQQQQHSPSSSSKKTLSFYEIDDTCSAEGSTIVYEEEASGSLLKAARASRSDYCGDEQHRRGKILVVDDSSVALHVTCRAIERQFNCEVHTASSAIEALSLYEHNEYNAVLTDMIMPHMDGFQLVSALRAREEKKKNLPGARPKQRLFICALTQLAEVLDVQNSADVDVVSRKPSGKPLNLDFLKDFFPRRHPGDDDDAAAA